MMWSRRVVMLAAALRSLNLANRSGVSIAAFVPPSTTVIRSPIVSGSRSLFGSFLSGGRYIQVASTGVVNGSRHNINNGDNSNRDSRGSRDSSGGGSSSSSSKRVPVAKQTELGGGRGAAPRRRGGRGMSSGGASGAGRRGGGGRSRGGGRTRRPPDYGPNRAGQHRANVSPGTSVEVVQKQDQRTGRLTSGTVSRLLTSSGFHPRGIKVMLAGGVVGRVQNIAGIDGAEPIPGYAGLNTAAGYSSSGSSNGSNGVDSDRIDPAIVASSAIGAGRRRRDSPVEGVTSAAAAAADATTTAASAAAAAPTPARSSRPVRKFRAERVQGRSWSVEGGEVVARGAGGEEIRGGGDAFDDGAGFDRRRGKGGRGRGRR